MIVAIHAGAAMQQQPPLNIVSTLSRVYSGVLTTAQLRRVLRHVGSGVGVCCGHTADFFILPEHRAAAPEAMANANQLPWRAFSRGGLAPVPEEWQQTFSRFCLYSGGMINIHSLFERDLRRVVDLWDYTRAIRRANTYQVLDAITLAAQRHGLKI